MAFFSDNITGLYDQISIQTQSVTSRVFGKAGNRCMTAPALYKSKIDYALLLNIVYITYISDLYQLLGGRPLPIADFESSIFFHKKHIIILATLWQSNGT